MATAKRPYPALTLQKLLFRVWHVVDSFCAHGSDTNSSHINIFFSQALYRQKLHVCIFIFNFSISCELALLFPITPSGNVSQFIKETRPLITNLCPLMENFINEDAQNKDMFHKLNMRQQIFLLLKTATLLSGLWQKLNSSK